MKNKVFQDGDYIRPIKCYDRVLNHTQPFKFTSDLLNLGKTDNEPYIYITGFGAVHINNFELVSRESKVRTYTLEEMKKAFEAGTNWKELYYRTDEIKYQSENIKTPSFNEFLK